MNRRIVFICITVLMLIFYVNTQNKVTYISVEHPAVTYYNPKYVRQVNLTSRRHGRQNPVYYVGLHVEILFTFDNKVKIDFYFYEFLTNQYKRSFVEMHFRGCQLFDKDPFFGAAMKRALNNRTCPYPPGVYDLANMTVSPSAIPPGFPITKGRIYVNLTLESNIFLGSAYVDMEIRQIKVNNQTKNTYF